MWVLGDSCRATKRISTGSAKTEVCQSNCFTPLLHRALRRSKVTRSASYTRCFKFKALCGPPYT